MKVLVVVDKANADIYQYIKLSYHCAGIPYVFQRLGHELYHDDPMMELSDYGISKLPDGVKPDLVILTHITDLSVFKYVEDGTPFIFEDADVYKQGINKACTYSNCILMTPHAKAAIPSEYPEDRIFELPFVYSPKYEKEIPTDPEYDMVLVANLYYQDRYNRFIRSKIADQFKIGVSGVGWDTKSDLPSTVEFMGYKNYKLDPISSHSSLIDFRRVYFTYDHMTPKVSEALYQGHVPLMPKIPKVSEYFSGDIADKFAYTHYSEWASLITNAKNLDDRKSFILEQRDAINSKLGIEAVVERIHPLLEKVIPGI